MYLGFDFDFYNLTLIGSTKLFYTFYISYLDTPGFCVLRHKAVEFQQVGREI